MYTKLVCLTWFLHLTDLDLLSDWRGLTSPGTLMQVTALGLDSGDSIPSVSCESGGLTPSILCKEKWSEIKRLSQGEVFI